MMISLLEFLIFLAQVARRRYRRVFGCPDQNLTPLRSDFSFVVKLYENYEVSFKGLYNVNDFDIANYANHYGPDITWDQNLEEKKTFWEIYRFAWLENIDEENSTEIIKEYLKIPIGYGPLYMNSMEVGIRLHNLTRLFPNNLSVQKRLRSDYFFILQNLEVTFSLVPFKKYAHNHYLFGLLGMYSFCKNLFVLKWIKKEIERQFPANRHFESSGHYHYFLLGTFKAILPKEAYSNLIDDHLHFGDNDSGWTSVIDFNGNTKLENIYDDQFHVIKFDEYSFCNKTAINEPTGHSHLDILKFNVFFREDCILPNPNSHSYVHDDLRNDIRKGIYDCGPSLIKESRSLGHFEKIKIDTEYRQSLGDYFYRLEDLGFRREVHLESDTFVIRDVCEDDMNYNLTLRTKLWLKQNEAEFICEKHGLIMTIDKPMYTDQKFLSFGYRNFELCYVLKSLTKEMIIEIKEHAKL